jgi:hypothetical protein
MVPHYPQLPTFSRHSLAMAIRSSRVVLRGVFMRFPPGRTALEQWHVRQVESLQTDLDKKRKTKNWFAALPGIINENLIHLI